MHTWTATGIIHPDHTLTVQVPSDIPPGTRSVVIVLGEATPAAPLSLPLHFSPHSVGLANEAWTFRREDMYGGDGR
jgi:hypothetical protein